MKCKLLLVLLLLLPAYVFAQSVNPLFQDGKIWFKMTNEARLNLTLKENPYKLDIATIPGLSAFSAKYGISNLSKPFYAAKTSQELQLTFLVEFSNYAMVDDFVKDLAGMKGVEYAEKVPLDKKCLTPNDPSFGSQWGLATIGATTAWNYFSTGSTTKIAIVDDAVERTHSDLSPNLWVNPGEIAANNIDDDGNGYIDDINGYDVGSNDNNPNPPNGSYDHGTHVAGISSARSNNGVGVASIGFSCKLMCIKSTNTPTAITNGYDGIVYAAASGANVINCSWGGPTSSVTGQNVVNYAWNQGCIIVAAAGNDNVSSQFYPAAFNNVLSVAATQSGDSKASFSNYGSWIDISAPGNNIYSTTVGNTYGNKSGTSMASPMVAGLIGLMRSLSPTMPRADLINCLLTTATNINAQNPSYLGQLGSGRINAAAAMTCVSSTLNNPPVADFVANYTTITAGGSVTYTNLSTYSPTSWSWSFPGGTPASFNGQNPPPVTYAVAGTYNAVLTVTNANGTDTETKTNYITVNAAGGCHRINLPAPGTWTPVNYGTGAPVGADGWVNGMNVYLDKQKGMYYDASALPYTILNNVWIAFGAAYSANPAKIVTVRVYDGTSGTPGALLGSSTLTMGQIMADVNGGFYTEVPFVNNPVTLPASKRFFVTTDLTNLQWTAGVKDTLSIVSNTNGQTTPSPIWEQQSDNLWYQYTTAGSWNLSASLYIHPFLTNAPTQAVFTQSATTVCQGQSIEFDAAGSTYQDTLLWVFPGGAPQIVAENPTASVIFNNPGTYSAILYVVGGGCNLFDSAFVNITVSPTPTVNVTGIDEICSGGSTNLTASGASSFLWAPPTGLSATTGANVTANPTTTTTYNVSGTTGGCTGNTTIQIEVLNVPTGMIMADADTIDCNASVMFDGSMSNDVTTFAWTFPTGSPATSNASGESVMYATPGTHNVQMIISNNCGSDTSSGVIVVRNNCSTSGIDDESTVVNGYYSYPMQAFIIESSQEFTSDMLVQLVNNLGQMIYTRKSNSGTNQIMIPTYELAPGMYIVQVTGSSLHQSFKFIIK